MTDKKHEKVWFKYYSNILNKKVTEVMWAEVIDESKGIYKLSNIPFYGAKIACDDEFYAEFDEIRQVLIYQKTLKPSGNSVVVVIVNEDFEKEELRKKFKTLNCISEGFNEYYFTMEILKTTDYSIIKQKLDDYEEEGILEYAEPYLSKKHWNEVYFLEI